MCIHGQKAISRKSEPNLSEGRRGGEHKKFCSFTHMCCRPSFLLLRRNSSATRRWI